MGTSSPLIRAGRRALKELERAKQKAHPIRHPDSPDPIAAYKADPPRLMRDAGFVPDPWQAEFLSATDQKCLLLCGRQVGKSQAVATLALHTALTKPGSLTTIVAQRQDTAAETLRKAVTAYYKCGAPVPILRQGTTHFELTTGSRILALPGEEKAMHGPTSDLLVIDEAARVPDEVFHAASPQLSASKGRLVALSTAFTKSGWFYREWQTGEDYRRWSITARECPRHTAKYLAGERRSMGERWFQMAYYNVFGDDIMAVFSSADIDRAVSDEVKPLFGPMGLPSAIVDAAVSPLFGR